MAIRRQVALIFSLVVLVSCAVIQVPSHHEKTGVLNRYNVSDWELKGVIEVAQQHNLDIWHIDQSHIDIYLPSSYPHTQLQLELPEPISSNTIPKWYPSNSSSQSTLAPNNSPWNLTSLTNTTFHSTYHPLYEVDEFMREVVRVFPERARMVAIGRTAEGREMWGITVSSSRSGGGGGDSLEDDEDSGDLEATYGGEGTLNQVPLSEGSSESLKKRKKKPKQCTSSDSTSSACASKKLSFVIVGAQHAREWIATSASLYILHALVVNATKEEPRALGDLLDVYDFHFIPMPNPDGYAFTWESDRYWYKNRQVIGPNSKCIGLDMNRNWGYKWSPTAGDDGDFSPDDNDGADDDDNAHDYVNATTTTTKKKHAPPKIDPCSHWYPGQRAFESPEANNIANFINTLPDVVAFVDLRSYGQMLSMPYSYTCAQIPKDAEDMMEAALGATQALRMAHGTAFRAGSLCEMVYRAPGNIVDWMYARAGIKYSYVARLRDTGTYGFSLPEKWIRPVGEETGEMVHYIAKFIAKQMNKM